MRLSGLFTIVILLYALGSFGQPGFNEAYALLEKGRYLKALDTVQVLQRRYNRQNHIKPGSPFDVTNSQNVTLLRSFVGESALGLNHSNTRRNQTRGNQFAPAIAYIAKEAAHRQVVMINEHHLIPKHRIFIANLLDTLYQLGYRYLAAEALVPGEDAPISLKYTNLYTKEPNMANMLLKAQKLGFTLVAYESEDTTAYDPKKPFYADNLRELNQARNLYQVLLKDPNAKMLVHVGLGHHLEKAGNDLIMMGEYFRVISGIDPFTIYEPADDTDEFRAELDKSNALTERGTPYIVLNSKSVPRLSSKENPGSYDVLLSWPSAHVINGRKDYLLKKNHTPVTLIHVTDADAGKLLQIREDGNEDAVPADQFMVRPNVKQYASALPTGSYLVQLVDKEGKVLRKRSLTVK